MAVNTPKVSYQGGSYSVPHTLLGETVWVRVHGAGRDERVAAADAEKMLVNARRALRRAEVKAAELVAAGGSDPVAGRPRGRLHRAVNDLAELLDATREIAAQTRQRVAGTTPAGGE